MIKTGSALSLFIMAITAAPFSAGAAPYTYGPENCEFQITFPEKPFIETKCDNDDPKVCSEIVTYTKTVAAAEASTNFRISCNPITMEQSRKYTPEILEETLKQMTKSAGFEPYDSRSSSDGKYRKASSLSLSERNGKPLIYNNQIWAGKTSIFTLEAQMVGQKNAEVEKTFADILGKTYPKDTPPKNTPPRPKTPVPQNHQDKK